MTTQTIIVLKDEFKEILKKNPLLTATIATKLGKHPETLKRWRLQDSKSLVAPIVLEIIREYRGLSESEVLTEEKEIIIGTGCENNNALAHSQVV